MATTYYGTQTNPQQNPVYQRQQQIVTTQYPTQTAQYDKADGEETFLQRQQRIYGGATTNSSQQTQNSGAAPNLQAPVSSTSPVTPNGKLSMAPAVPLLGVQGQGPAYSAQTTGNLNGEPNVKMGQLGQPNVAPGLTPMPAPQQTPVDPRTFQPPAGQTADQFFASLTPGTPVPGQPGATYQHNGQGWVIQSGGAAGQPGAPGAPGTAFPGLPQLPANATYYAEDLGNTPFSTYQPFQFNQAGLPTYQAGQINLAQLLGYQPGQISQFQGPDQSGIDAQTQALISSILGNPLSMSDQNVAALKERQKEQALSQQRQFQDAAAQSAASRGLSPGSGFLQTAERRGNDATLASLLSGNRDIDLAKMQQDQQDRMAAASLGDQFLSSQLGRAVQGYQARLAGEGLREQSGQAAADDARLRAALSADVQGRNLDELFRAYGTQADARKFGFGVEQAQAGENQRGFQSIQDSELNSLQRALQQAGINQKAADSGLQGFRTMLDAYNAQQGRGLEGRQLDISERLGQGGLDLDRAKLGETGRQFDKGYQLDFLNYLLNRDQLNQQGRQFQDSLGLDWFKANSANTNNWLNLLP